MQTPQPPAQPGAAASWRKREARALPRAGGQRTECAGDADDQHHQRGVRRRRRAPPRRRRPASPRRPTASAPWRAAPAGSDASTAWLRESDQVPNPAEATAAHMHSTPAITMASQYEAGRRSARRLRGLGLGAGSAPGEAGEVRQRRQARHQGQQVGCGLRGAAAGWARPAAREGRRRRAGRLRGKRDRGRDRLPERDADRVPQRCLARVGPAAAPGAATRKPLMMASVAGASATATARSVVTDSDTRYLSWPGRGDDVASRGVQRHVALAVGALDDRRREAVEVGHRGVGGLPGEQLLAVDDSRG